MSSKAKKGNKAVSSLAVAAIGLAPESGNMRELNEAETVAMLHDAQKHDSSMLKIAEHVARRLLNLTGLNTVMREEAEAMPRDKAGNVVKLTKTRLYGVLKVYVSRFHKAHETAKRAQWTVSAAKDGSIAYGLQQNRAPKKSSIADRLAKLLNEAVGQMGIEEAKAEVQKLVSQFLTQFQKEHAEKAEEGNRKAA